MWVFSQNTIAGDLGVTPIVQCLASMLISSTLVHTDLHNHAIQPLAFCYPHVEHLPDPRDFWGRRRGHTHHKGDLEKAGQLSSADGSSTASPARSAAVNEMQTTPTRGFAYYYWMLVRFIFEGTEQNMLLAKPGFRAWWGRFLWTAAQGAAIGIVFGFPLWCLAVVILGPIYGTRNMGARWAPQVIKMVYGAIVGWVTNPVIAVLALGSQAECHLVVVEHEDVGAEGSAEVGEAGVEEQEELTMPIPTIVEGQEFDPAAHNITPSRKHSLAGQGSLRLVVPPSPSFSATSVPPSPSGAGGTWTRSRSGSTSSRISMPRGSGSRPPLTANVSYLAPLPTNARSMSDMGTGRVRAHSNAQMPGPAPSPLLSPSSLRGRPRGATVGQAHHSTDNTGTARPAPSPALGAADARLATPRSASYSYALGGTGGRAQRSRSASVVSQLPTVAISAAAPLSGGEAAPSQPQSARPSIISLGPSVVSPRALRPASPAQMPQSGAGQGGTPVWDVFGRKESTGG
jgi:hypothetical protein